MRSVQVLNQYCLLFNDIEEVEVTVHTVAYTRCTASGLENSNGKSAAKIPSVILAAFEKEEGI